MIRILKDRCVPDTPRPGEPPNYTCLPNGDVHYFSRDEKKSFLFGGECPKLCPIKNVPGNTCPDVAAEADPALAKSRCEVNQQCHFIGRALFGDPLGPNYCVPEQQKGCITLTSADLVQSDQHLTDGACDRLGKGCVFNRGTGDGKTSRRGDVTCIKGCQGTKYWKNPKYMWGGGSGFIGAWQNSDLKVGPKYLEAAPTPDHLEGWGGKGRLPSVLGEAYTESRGARSPPCNINDGDVGAFTGSGDELAGPGCTLTPPDSRSGQHDWSYTCRCPYLGDGDVGEFRPDAWTPCADSEFQQDFSSDRRDVCSGCMITDGECVLGTATKDTESEILGCVPGTPGVNCRVNRTIQPTQCPAFCLSPQKNKGWVETSQCAKALKANAWIPNPSYKLTTSVNEKRAPMYVKGPGTYTNNLKDNDDLCRNCAQTPMESIGSGTLYPNRSRCVVGGSDLSGDNTDITRKIMCPATCRQCHSGYFGEPLEAKYSLKEASSPSSAFSSGILYVPWKG